MSLHYQFRVAKADLCTFRAATIEDSLVELTTDSYATETREQGEQIAERLGIDVTVELVDGHSDANRLATLAKDLGVIIGMVEVYADGTVRINHVDGSCDDYRTAARAERAIREMAE